MKRKRKEKERETERETLGGGGKRAREGWRKESRSDMGEGVERESERERATECHRMRERKECRQGGVSEQEETISPFVGEGGF